MNRFFRLMTAVAMTVMLAGCTPKTLPLGDEDYATASLSSEQISVVTESSSAAEATTESIVSASETEEAAISETEASEADTTVTEEETTQPETEYVTETEITYPDEESVTAAEAEKLSVEKDGSYTTPEDVAEYIHTFGTLPKNFITKKEAKALGWSGGSLEKYAPGMSIGGDYFGNNEEILPKAKGRKYTECDVNYDGGKRGAERIVFSNDGLIFYTNDHYESFTQLY